MKNGIFVNKIVNTVYASNTYIITSYDNANVDVWIIDVGDIEPIVGILPEMAQLKGILLTHTHYDHIYGINNFLQKFPNAKVYTNAYGKQALLSPKLNYSKYHLGVEDIVCNKPENIELVDDGMTIPILMDGYIQIIATPGHDESCLTYIVGDYVFSGDSYIPKIQTRATFILSDKAKVSSSELIIINKSIHHILCPGHGPVYEDFNELDDDFRYR